jgi:tRNA-specific 2-thiouridylase
MEPRLTRARDWRKQQPMSSPADGAPRARERVLCAMSGGVDSSLAAALLHEAGYEVIGVTLHLWDARGEDQVGRCCSPEDRDDARRTCDLLGVPHYVLDEREAFRSHVVDPFLDDNLRGKTPIPCVQCNQQVKLLRLWEVARTFGATQVATGHYARLARADGGQVELLRGKDLRKDQSYFLFGVPQAVLSRLTFPLGEMSKDEAREHARRFDLPNWNKPDSQELCFIPSGDVREFIGRERPSAAQPGPLLDSGGRVVGAHEGIEGVPVGQRRGIGIAAREPRYVLRVVPEQNAVVVGGADELLGGSLRAERAAWIGAAPEQPFEAEVRIRYRHEPAAARVVPSGREFSVEFQEPQRAIAPGQAAVIYRGDKVVGGGFIAA